MAKEPSRLRSNNAEKSIAALLVKHEASFIKYLQSIVPDLVLPAQEITEAERAWRRAIIRDFYNVGPALADYLVGDWLLWLWREGQIEWFESYKADSVFLKTLADKGKLPPEAATDFPKYSSTLRLPQEGIPKSYWNVAHYPLPPRVLNEAIWLEEAETNKTVATNQDDQRDEIDSHRVPVDIERVKWPIRFHHLWGINVEEDSFADGSIPHLRGDAILFRDDDQGYKAWLASNPQCYVVNTYRKPEAKYLVLHRASCWCIARPLKDEESWTATYIKVCASARTVLEDWTRDEVGGSLHECGICCR